MPNRRKWIVMLVLACMLLERPALILSQPLPEPMPAEAGLIITVEGIGGLDMIGINAVAAFRKAGIPHEVRRFTWTHGTGRLLLDLQDTQHILKKAEELAKIITDYRKLHPTAPIYIVAKSGGTGLALFATQLLPPNTIDRLILLSAAVSPNFDLRPALRATKREVVSFYSHNDQFILNWGTRTFGTIDRFYGPSAGMTGFVLPANLNDDERRTFARLIQVPWQARMLRDAHYVGTHSGTSMPGFLQSEVAPWLR
jgi:hypothetical protein